MIDRIRSGYGRLKSKLGSNDPLMVMPYRGYANEQKVFLKGRVLEDEGIFKGKSKSEIQNLLNSIKRFETDEIANARVQVNCGGFDFWIETDEEGYFILDEKWPRALTSLSNNWIDAEITLIHPQTGSSKPIKADAEILFPLEGARFGLITDIDDTILQTHVSSLFKLKMLYETFFKDADQRVPMEGMAALLNRFASNQYQPVTNPVFYVSHSPWNIYDLLTEFLELRDFPKGPVLLRDYGLNPAGEYKLHKMHSISHILETYDHLPFVLMGDSAERDADIYIDVAIKYPERVKAIYIRKTRDNRNALRIKALIESQVDVEAVLVDSAEAIAEHAESIGIL